MQANIVAQGLELMLYGMGTVVLFLALLVLATAVMSWTVGRYFPDPEPPAVPARHKLRPQGSPGIDPRVVAAISAALHQHRGKRK